MAESYNDLLADRAAEHALELQRYSVTARRQVLGYLARLEERLEDELRRSRLGDPAGQFERDVRLRALLDQVQRLASEEYGELVAAAEGVMTEAAQLEVAHAVTPLRPVAIAADVGLGVPTVEQLRSIASNVLIDGSPSREWWSRQAGDLVQRFADEIRDGLVRGESIDELVRRVRGQATGRRHTFEIAGRRQTYVEFAGGLIDTSTRQAEALVRSSVAAVSSDARRATFEANQDVVKGVVQISTFDTRTTTICLAYGGKAWAYPDMEPIGHLLPYAGGTPRHWNCRSTEAPLLRSWRELGINLDDAGAGRRWSRLDGKVPGDWTMDDFLGRRTKAQLDAQLGPGVAELYRAGEISLDDLVSRATGRPLTVAEIEAMAGSAA